MKSIKRTILLLLCLCLLPAFAVADDAPAAKDLSASCTLTYTGRHPGAGTAIHSRFFEATVTFAEGELFRFAWTDDVPAYYLCTQWLTVPQTARVVSYDRDGAVLAETPLPPYMDSFYPLPDGARAVEVIAGEGGMTVVRAQMYSEGVTPHPYHDWQPAPEHLDYLLIATHPDDDTLFMGACIPLYGAKDGKVGTVAFLTASKRERMTEAQNGVWAMGSRYYPLFLGFADVPQARRSTEGSKFLAEDVTKALVRLLREHRPLVVFTQDYNGEYGHWQHSRVAHCVTEAVQLCADPAYDPDSAAAFGTWEVKKCYVHLYPENPLTLDIDTPIAALGGKTAFEVAKQAFALHESQQSGRHHVNGVREPYSIARFGMVYGTVEAGTDAFDNIDPALLYANLSAQTPAPTETPIPVPTDTPAPTEAPTPVPTDTPAPTEAPTPVPTDTPAPTDTPVPTEAPTPAVSPAPETVSAPTVWTLPVIALLCAAELAAAIGIAALVVLRKRK